MGYLIPTGYGVAKTLKASQISLYISVKDIAIMVGVGDDTKGHLREGKCWGSDQEERVQRRRTAPLD